LFKWKGFILSENWDEEQQYSGMPLLGKCLYCIKKGSNHPWNKYFLELFSVATYINNNNKNMKLFITSPNHRLAGIGQEKVKYG
jgi:hypothetical protein